MPFPIVISHSRVYADYPPPLQPLEIGPRHVQNIRARLEDVLNTASIPRQCIQRVLVAVPESEGMQFALRGRKFQYIAGELVHGHDEQVPGVDGAEVCLTVDACVALFPRVVDHSREELLQGGIGAVGVEIWG